MFSVAVFTRNSKQANKRAQWMRVDRAVEMNH